MRNNGEAQSEINLFQTDPRQIPTSSLPAIIQELDNCYAEILSDQKSDSHLLNMVWKRIRDLREELTGRSS